MQFKVLADTNRHHKHLVESLTNAWMYILIPQTWINSCINRTSVTFHGIYSFPRDSFIANISMHFWATLDVA